MHPLHPMHRRTCRRSFAITPPDSLYSALTVGIPKLYLPSRVTPQPVSRCIKHESAFRTYSLQACANPCTVSSNGRPGTRARCSPPILISRSPPLLSEYQSPLPKPSCIVIRYLLLDPITKSNRYHVSHLRNL